MKKTLYLIRHGQTRFNALHRIQGASDSPLTELGISQAKQARQLLDGIEFDHYYCSTQERASDTLELLTYHQVAYTRLKGLKEFDFGDFEGQSEQLNPKSIEDYATFFKPYGGETQTEVANRMNATLKEIMLNPDHHCVLAVSHGGAIGNFAKLWLDWHQVSPRGFKNLSTLVFEFDTETQTFEFQRLLTLEMMN